MKKTKIINGSNMRYTGDGRELTGEERFCEKIENFINDVSVINIYYSSHYVDNLTVSIGYSVIIIYKEEVE